MSRGSGAGRLQTHKNVSVSKPHHRTGLSVPEPAGPLPRQARAPRSTIKEQRAVSQL